MGDKNRLVTGQWWHTPWIPALKGVEFCEFKASLGYKVSSRKKPCLEKATHN